MQDARKIYIQRSLTDGVLVLDDINDDFSQTDVVLVVKLEKID